MVQFSDLFSRLLTLPGYRQLLLEPDIQTESGRIKETGIFF